jgi:glucokinase
VLTGREVAVGIGAAGLIDVRRGVLLSSPNLAWREVPLRERIRERFGLPVTVDNDATAGAWAESRVGASRDHEDSLFVGVGTGIGGGIVAGGRLIRGAYGLAGEIGHVIVEPDGPRCGCGNRGCWEQVASGLAISRAGRRAVEEHPDSAIARLAEGDPLRATGELVTSAAREGDGVAVRILSEVGRRLGEGVAGLVNVLDPEIVVVGGGAAAAGELLLGAARHAFQEAVEGADVRPEVPIVPAALGNDAGAIGAALLAIEAAGA